MKVEIGYFFCGNCCRVEKERINVQYEQKPKSNCVTCGMEEWIFEPTGELDTTEIMGEQHG